MQNDTGPGTDVARGCRAQGKAGGKCPLRASPGEAGPSPGCLGTPAARRQPPGSLPGGSPVAAGTAGLGQGDSYAQLLGANGHLHGSQGFGLEKGIRVICTDFSLSSLKSLQVTLFLKCFLKSLMQLHACDTEFL